MTKFTVRIKDKDVNLLRRLARRHKMTPENYLKEVVEAWIADKRAQEKGLVVPHMRSVRLISPTATSVEQSQNTSASPVAITFA
jgi:hypothetical protein